MKSHTLAILAALFAALPSTNAATILIGNFDGSSSGLFSDTIGYAFTVGSLPLEVYEAGVYDSTLDGLANQNQLGIWTNSGTLLASKIFAPGTGAPLQQSFFRWLALDTPLILAANTTYRVAVFAQFEDRLSRVIGGGPVSDDVTLIGAVRSNNFSSFAFPGAIDPASFPGQAVIGPNLRYNVVPEPGSAVLLLAGFSMLTLRRHTQ